MSDHPPVAIAYILTTSAASHGDDIACDMVNTFLRAHDLDPKRFLVGTTLEVVVHDDGSRWLRTWLAVDGLPACEHCPACVQQEQVEKELAAPVPAVPESRVYPGLLGPDLIAHPADRVAAAESAYRATVDEQVRIIAASTRIIERRQDQLAAARGEDGSVIRRMHDMGLLPSQEPTPEVAGE